MAETGSKISSTAPERVLPEEFGSIDINFCRDPICRSFADHPYPFNIEMDVEIPSGYSTVSDVSRNNDELRHKCPECWKSSIVKSNKAIFLEYHRQMKLRLYNPTAPACRNENCLGNGRPLEKYPEQYRSYGKTASGDQRHQCKLCKKTFSIGKPARRHKRSDKNKFIFDMLVNNTALSKICVLAEISYSTLYEKIDYIYERVRSFTAGREGILKDVDWIEFGSRFTTDSQSLFINWPTKRKRTPVLVQHLCTAHERSGFVVAASIQFDPDVDMKKVQAEMLADGDFEKPLAFRNQSRVWSQAEFDAHIAAIQKLSPPDAIPELYQLPHKGALVRSDILHFAHALLLRDIIGDSPGRFMFVLDAEDSIRLAITSAMADLIKDGRAQITTVSFEKGMNNDRRNRIVAEGRARLSAMTGKSVKELDALPNQEFTDLVDQIIAPLLENVDLRKGFLWPFHTKSEPNRTIKVITPYADAAPESMARMLRLATLRSVDSYFHRFRSNIRFAQRAGRGASNGGRAWDRY